MRSVRRLGDPVLLVPCALALVVRVVYVVAQDRYQVFSVAFEASDSHVYRAIADQIATHGRYVFEGHPTAHFNPGFPLFLAALYSVSRATLWIALANAVCGAVMVLLIADVARRLAGRRAALLAGLAAAVYPHLVFWTGYVLSEPLFLLLVVAALDLTVVAAERRSLRLAAAAGACFGLAALTRPVILGFAIALGVGLVACSGERRRAAFVGLVGLAVVLAPWAIRNEVQLGTAGVTSTESGYVLWQGNSPDANGGRGGYVDPPDFQPLRMPAGSSEAKVDRRYARAARSWMLHHPGRVARLVPTKLANLFLPTYPDASRLNVAVTLLTYPFVLLLGVAGLVLAWGRATIGRVLALAVLYLVASHALITGMIRFRLPIEAILLVGVGIAGDALLARRGERAAARS